MAVLKLLNKGEFCVNDIVGELEFSQPKVSLILKELRDYNLVTVVVIGKRRFYSINRVILNKYFDDIKKMLSDFETNSSNEIIVRRIMPLSN